MNGLPNGNIPRQHTTPALPVTQPGVPTATVQDAQPAGAERPQGDPQRANACSRLKDFLKSLPARNKGFAYLYAAAGGAGTGAKVGAVFTLGHPVGTISVSTAYMILALVAQATKDNHKDFSEAIMNLEGLTSEAAGTAMKSGPWGLRFMMWTLQSAEVIEQAKANGLNEFQTASLVGFTGGFAVLTHTLVIAAVIDLIASADKMATRTFGGALEAAGTPLRTVAPTNWSQAVSFGFGPPAVLAWAGAVATGNTDMLIGGFAKSLTKSVAESAVVASGTIATMLFTLGTGYAINKGDKFAPIKIDASMLNELRATGVPLLVTGARMSRVSLFEFAPSENTCKQVMKDLAQAASSPPVLFGIATFANYYLAQNPEVDVLGLFTAADTGTQPPVDGGDDIHRVAGRVLVSTLPYGAAWALELLKGWDLSKSADGVKRLDQVTPTKLGDLEQALFCLMTAGSVAWTTEVLGAPEAMETTMPPGLGVLLSVMVPFGGVLASGVLASNSKRLASDAVVTLAAGVMGGLEPDLHGKEIMLGTLGLWMGGRALIEWSTGNMGRISAAALAGGERGHVPARPAGNNLAPPQNDGAPSANEPLLPPGASQGYVPYSEAALEDRRWQISNLLGIPYVPGAALPGDGALSSSSAGNSSVHVPGMEQFVIEQLGPAPWTLPAPAPVVTFHIDAEKVREHLEDNGELSIHVVDDDSTSDDDSPSSPNSRSRLVADPESKREAIPNRASTVMHTPTADTQLRTPERTTEQQMRSVAQRVINLTPQQRAEFLESSSSYDRERIAQELQKLEQGK